VAWAKARQNAQALMLPRVTMFPEVIFPNCGGKVLYRTWESRLTSFFLLNRYSPYLPVDNHLLST
jgi:hypothetical protein